jgi:hypothetical protein
MHTNIHISVSIAGSGYFATDGRSASLSWCQAPMADMGKGALHEEEEEEEEEKE